MVTILFAWELGSNLGHLTRDLPLARACRDAGYRVVFAVSNLRIATALFAGEDFVLVQAPALKSSIVRNTAPVSFPDMLLHDGYDDAEALHAAFTGWEGLFALVRPQLLVYNHAPTALLAAHCCKIPVLVVGTGFEIPLRGAQPSFRPWQAIPHSVLADAEQTAVAQINRLLERRQTPPLATLGDLYADKAKLLTTFPELDHFGARPGERYIGPVAQLGKSAGTVKFLSQEGKRIFAYLRLGLRGCEHVLAALQNCGAEVLCVIPGAPVEWVKRFDRIRIHPEAVNLPALLPAADLVLAYGAGTIATALLAGAPVLCVPHLAEQYLAGLALENTGAGLMLREAISETAAAAAVQTALGSQYRQAAQGFAKRHAGFDMQEACAQFMDEVQRLISTDSPTAKPKNKRLSGVLSGEPE